MGIKLTPRQQNALLKCAKNGSVSAQNFREIIAQSFSNEKKQNLLLYSILMQ